MEYTHNKRKWINAGGAVVVIAALFTIAYLVADKFGDPNDRVADTIEVIVPHKGSEVFVDGTRVQLTDGNNRKITVSDLSQGKHVILIAKEGYWPWTKEIDLKREKVEVSAFMLPMRAVASEVPVGSDEYQKAQRLFNEYVFPAPNPVSETLSKLKSDDEHMEVWVQGSLIHAAWVSDKKPSQFYDPDRSACEAETCLKWVEVIDAASPITSIDFFKRRNDIIVFSMDDSIYAIEINKKGTQNFQPIYKGTKPTFVKSDDNSYIYIKDEGSIWKTVI